MEVARQFADLVGSLVPPRGFILALVAFAVVMGGLLIAIGEKDRGILYLIAALLGGILAAFARPLLRGLLGI
ncbi:hypothetical protein TNMX_01120 [Thermus sp. NMX2.A1]|nr:hypothetical protein TNMX_01120 [Thermus sp. NMX2.A1]